MATSMDTRTSSRKLSEGNVVVQENQDHDDPQPGSTIENNSDKQLESLVQKKTTFAPVPTSASSKTLGPRRKSMYDHVEVDFVKSGKKTHLFRLVVAGTHEEDPSELLKMKRWMIEDINSVCHEECATGFFLAYPKQFIHVLEGSEDTLNNYLSRCAETFELSEGSQTVGGDDAKIHKVKMLVLGYFAIQERFLSRWLQTKFNPPRQVAKVESGFRKNLFELVRTCLLLAIIMSKQPAMKNGEIDWPDQGNGQKTRERREQDLQLMQYLPSQHVIMYIMKDKPRRIKLKTPSEFIRKSWDVPDVILTKELCWPIPCHIAPYD